MPSLKELQYAIETNTSGLNKAFPALDKLAASLERLDKTIQSFGASSSKGFDQVGNSFDKQARGVEQSAKKIKAALDRQQAATVSAQQKLLSLNKAIQNAGGDPKLIAANTAAYNQLEAALKRTDITAGEVTLSKAKYNATLAQTKRTLLEFSSAQKKADQDSRASEAAMIKQTNAVERMRIRYLDLKNALESKGAGDKLLGNLDATFASFEKNMSGGVLSTAKFSEAMNKTNAEFARIKRSEGFARGVTAGVRELASSAQVALGPLSGVASRITALGTLSRTTSIAIAGTVGVVLAFGAAIVKSVIDGARLEAQMLRINSILRTTGNEFLITGDNAEKVVRKVANLTGVATGDVREAAAGFLTIKGMNEELLQSSLEAAQGLALIGGGSIQTSFRNLSQALQNPAEGLNTLTQYGIKFNESQRREIELLELSGNRQEARMKLLERLSDVSEAAKTAADSLTGSWSNLLKEFSDASADFANAIGLIDLLKNGLQGLSQDLKNTAKEFRDAGVGVGYLASLFGFMQGSSGALQGQVIKLYDAIQRTDSPEESLEQLREKLNGLIEQIKNNPAEVDFGDIQKAIDAINAGNIDAAASALSKYSQVQKEAAATAQVHKNRLAEVEDWMTKLTGQYLPLLREQEDSRAQLDGLTKNWSAMKEVLMASGKTAEQAEAQLRRLRNEVELGSNSVTRFINDMQKSTQLTLMDINITRASGAEKRRLQTEQRVLNQLWASGIITASNYKDALQELKTMGLGGLADQIAAATKEAENADFTKSIAEMNTALDEQLKLAKVAYSVATSSAYEQAQALAVAAKMQEMLNRGIEVGSAEWDGMIAKVKEITSLDFAGKWLKDMKDLEDQVRLASAAMDAAGKSAIEEALAVALINEKVRMTNEGIAEGTALWNQRLAATRALVEMDFTKQHKEAMKAMQGEVLAQQRQLDFMFYSEKTRERMVALSEKEYELAQKYGSLQDARAQKELQLFKILQDRQSVISEFQQVADVIDNAFQSMEDSLVEFFQTGEFNFKKFANSILEDIFRMTYKMVVTDPLHDFLGNMFKGITGKATDAGAMPSVADAFQIGTLANPSYTYVLNDMGMPGNLTDILTGGDGKGTGLGSAISSIGKNLNKALGEKSTDLFGGKSTQDLLRKGLDPLTKASSEASSGLVDLGNGITMTGDAFARKMELMTQEAAKFGDVATNSIGDLGELRGSLNDFGSSLSKATTKSMGALDALNKNFGGASDTLSNLQHSYIDAADAVKPLTKGGGLADLVQPKVMDVAPQALNLDGSFLNKKSMDLLGKIDPNLSAVVQNAQKYMPAGETFQVAPSTLRTLAQQKDFVARGLSTTMNSKHLTGDAVDLNLFKDGKYSKVFEDYQNMADAMKKSAQELGVPMKWGGDWKSFKDGPHFEVPKNFTGPIRPPETIPPGMDQLAQQGIGSPFQQLPQQMQVPGMPNPMMGNPMAGGPMMGNTLPGMGGGTSPFASGGGSFTGAGMGGTFTGGGIGSDATSSLGGLGGMGGGDITGQLRGSLDNLSQSVNQTTGSFTSLTEGLPEVTSNLTTGLDKAATSASDLADDGLRKASNGMNQLATDTITQSVTAQAQSAASTQQMGTASMTTSASVQMLGQAAMTAAAQMQAGGAMGMVLHGGGIAGGSGGYAMLGGSFATAPRLHGGLHSDEFRAILKRGEGVFTEDQMDALGNAIKRNGDPDEEGLSGGSRRRGSTNVTVNLNGVKDFDSFRKSQAQLNAGISSSLRQASQSQD